MFVRRIVLESAKYGRGVFAAAGAWPWVGLGRVPVAIMLPHESQGGGARGLGAVVEEDG